MAYENITSDKGKSVLYGIIVLGAGVGIGAIFTGGDAPASKIPTEEVTSTNEASASQPEVSYPQYTSVDGKNYLYTSALSQDQQDAGVAANTILAFRFRGIKNGIITVTSDGQTITCAVDCKVITTVAPYTDKNYVSYNPETIIGSVFYDAMNGHLEENPK
jgi:hypothetical protein